ncbi:hypothetical protein NQZ68_032585 [Dissostichus eleginoides]|nr:hypothetical protein NQZ68_032585 [Dissostichus eleginoides]
MGEENKCEAEKKRGKREMEKDETSEGEEEGAGGAEGRVNSSPTRRYRALGAWYRGVHPRAPLPPPTNHPTRGQLSYAGLTASVSVCSPFVWIPPALLSQQLNNRWLKKASIERAAGIRKSHQGDFSAV